MPEDDRREIVLLDLRQREVDDVPSREGSRSRPRASRPLALRASISVPSPAPTSGPARAAPPHRSGLPSGRATGAACGPRPGQSVCPNWASTSRRRRHRAIPGPARGRWSRFRTSRRSSGRSAAGPGRPEAGRTRRIPVAAAPVQSTFSRVARLPPSLAGTPADRDHVEAVIETFRFEPEVIGGDLLGPGSSRLRRRRNMKS